MSNISSQNMSNETEVAPDLSKSFQYNVIVPVFILASLATFIINFVIILSYPLIRNLSRVSTSRYSWTTYQRFMEYFVLQVTRPYVTFILSLLISDAFASLLLGIQLLFGSYLPVVHEIFLGGCLMMIAEALRLAGVLATVFHLLVMVSIHLGGVMVPVKFADFMTQKVARSMVLLLWIIPFSIIPIYFWSIPNQGFQSANCSDQTFLMKSPFRIVYSSLIIVPTGLIMGIYVLFHWVLWMKRDISKSSISKQNIKAAQTTLIIMFTCTIGWLPAVFTHLLICLEGCQYELQSFSPDTMFTISSICYSLLIFKSFSNPMIFAIRQHNIREALKRLLHYIRYCQDVELPSYQGYHSVMLQTTPPTTMKMRKFAMLQGMDRGSRASSPKTSLLTHVTAVSWLYSASGYKVNKQCIILLGHHDDDVHFVNVCSTIFSFTHSKVIIFFPETVQFWNKIEKI